jgi:hypothetical protein
MGMFDSFYATVTCPVCNVTQEQEIQTKRGECHLNHFKVGDSILDKGFGVRTGEIETYFYCGNKECPTCIWVNNPDGKTRSPVDKTQMSAKLSIRNYRFIGATVWRNGVDEEPDFDTHTDLDLDAVARDIESESFTNVIHARAVARGLIAELRLLRGY